MSLENTKPNKFNNAEAVGHLAHWTINLVGSSALKDVLRRDVTVFGMAYAALYNFYPDMLPKREEAHTAETRTELKKLLSDMDRRYGAETTSQYGSIFFAGCLLHEEMNEENDFSRWDKFLRLAGRKAEEIKADNLSASEMACMNLKKLVDLTPTEVNILEFQICRADFAFMQFYDRVFSFAKTPELVKFILYSMFDDFDMDGVNNALSKSAFLRKSGLINFNESTGRIASLSQSMINWLISDSALIADDGKTWFGHLTKPLSKKQSASGSIGTLTPVDKTLIMSLLTTSSGKNAKAVNILAYGNKSIDKKNAVAALFPDDTFEVHSIETTNVPPSDYAVRTFIAQRWLSHQTKTLNKPHLLVIEHADSVLTRSHSGGGMMVMFGLTESGANSDSEDSQLETDEVLLAENPTPSIWLVDRPKNIIEENVGRFLFHCEIKPGSRADRRAQIDEVVKDLDLSEEVKVYLSKYQLLSANQVKSAARLANFVASNGNEAEEILKRGIQQSQRALQRDFMEELRESVTAYSLDFINTKSAFTPEQVLKALAKRPSGTLCLYGMPGTGKTQFAEYIAMTLDKPIIMKRASDILDKYVGGNEKNIAAMFAEAAEEDSILFLDEADSFLRDRSLARAEWSVTQVNELLQQMERFKGIFIVATNLFKDIDAAALRRFTFKFEFLALTNDQRWKMFVNETGININALEIDNPEELSEIKTQLANIKSLTPGDFAVVKRQSALLGAELTPHQWLDQLAEESKAKLVGLARNGMGFTGE